MDLFWLILSILGYLAQLALIPVLLLNKKKQPSSTVAWLMTIATLPLLGGVLFLTFGVNRVERKARKKRASQRVIGGKLPELTQYQAISGSEFTDQQRRLMRLAGKLSSSIATVGNRVEILADTNRTFGLIEQAVAEATDSIHLEYYIWQPDKSGTQLRDLLIQRAKEGVTVRFLYDGIGSLRLGKSFLKPMRAAGIHVSTFHPGWQWFRWSLNLRNHRKIVIIDGQTAFTGGMNIGDEYLGKDPEMGFWRDTHLRLRGPAVLQLQHVFAEDWYYATEEELTDPKYFPPPEEAGRVVAQTLIGEPTGDIEVFHQLMFSAINEAEKKLTMATSYFVPTPSLASALESAAYRGVRVRLLLPKRSAHMATVWAAHSYFDSLLRAGVHIYEYEKGMLHSKTMTIDDEWSLIGTPNFDSRSLLLNFEVGVVTYDTKLAQQLENDFEEDFRFARRIRLEEWQQRSKLRIVRENVCRLFAPVL